VFSNQYFVRRVCLKLKNVNVVGATVISSTHTAVFKNTFGFILMGLHTTKLDVDWRII
jgi:hypothetical protein